VAIVGIDGKTYPSVEAMQKAMQQQDTDQLRQIGIDKGADEKFFQSNQFQQFLKENPMMGAYPTVVTPDAYGFGNNPRTAAMAKYYTDYLTDTGQQGKIKKSAEQLGFESLPTQGLLPSENPANREMFIDYFKLPDGTRWSYDRRTRVAIPKGAVGVSKEEWSKLPTRKGTQESLKGSTDMAQQQDLKGKTGKELQEAILQEQAGQAEQQALDPSQELELQKRRVRPGELIDPNAYNIPETTITASKKLDTDDFQQQSPEKTAAPTYDATKVGSIGEMREVAGEVSDKAVMDAAQGSLSEGALATAATEELDARATVKYQMAELFKSIEEGSELPPWASPAVRKVSAIMAQRGLGSSSMAASAITQAIYEAGIPIAVQDANKYGAIQLQNLNNRQQAALQNATATASMDMANLNNRQAAAVNNAKTFLTMDMQNLTNAQQKATIDYQTTTSSLFTDAAADNAAKQFNAKTQNEVDQFFAELGSQVETTAINRNVALEQYNISQTQAVEQFNAQMIAQRETFNSNARRQIDASNAVWRRTINTENTALQNEENRTNLQTLLNLSQIAQNNLWQLYRDQAAWTMQTSENNLDRAHNAAMQAAAISERSDLYDSKFDDFLIIKTIDNIFG